MLEQVLSRLIRICEANNAVTHITGTSPDDVYLIRYYVLPRNRFFNVYIHLFMRSDADDFHDHPWHFCTWIARGMYKEEMPVMSKKTGKPIRGRVKSDYRTSSIGCNKFAFRRATDLHRVMLDRRYKLSEKHMAPMTLCITGPSIREWGFIKKSGKWVNWKTYLKLAPDTKER